MNQLENDQCLTVQDFNRVIYVIKKRLLKTSHFFTFTILVLITIQYNLIFLNVNKFFEKFYLVSVGNLQVMTQVNIFDFFFHRKFRLRSSFNCQPDGIITLIFSWIYVLVSTRSRNGKF